MSIFNLTADSNADFDTNTNRYFDTEVPYLLGRYLTYTIVPYTVRIAGAGNGGVVHCVRHKQTGTVIAKKMIHLEVSGWLGYSHFYSLLLVYRYLPTVYLLIRLDPHHF